ncbi:hypothetical protein SKAU_G00353810 [Synaphobranchus kaupii]|uniref:Uncharacterized protein n=1 Tax=Synaphobranchus kaupii TaxID=118154 RepID=A0A9Q1EL15_SYNKA|nr:hypothetical protein SKAU_G00353810 [Synaphobranchus kaupii]
MSSVPAAVPAHHRGDLRVNARAQHTAWEQPAKASRTPSNVRQSEECATRLPVHVSPVSQLHWLRQDGTGAEWSIVQLSRGGLSHS